MNKVSIIIPVYNTKDYLPRCLNSLINQTYKNLEIILVDNHSYDGSFKICNDYKKKDNRIIVLREKKQGVCFARNLGLKSCTGDFITFVDSDDYVNDNYIEILINNIIKYDADISICNAKISNNKKMYNGKKIFVSDKCLDVLVSHKYFKGQVWGKMYKKNILKDIYFDEKLSMYEDLYFNFLVFKNSKKIIYDSNVLYNYNKNSNSLMEQKYSPANLAFIKVTNEIKKYYTNNKLNLKNVNSLIDYLYICNLNLVIKQQLDSKNVLYVSLNFYVKKFLSRIIFHDSLKLKYKLAAFVMVFNRKFYFKIVKKRNL